MQTLGLKNINMLSKEQYNEIAVPSDDELYAISGSGFGFPSSYYEDLELGASGTQYTAPANGWIYLEKQTASSNQYINLVNDTKNYKSICHAPSNGNACRAMLPIEKNDVFRITYSADGATQTFRFIYAEGEE